MSTSSAPAPGRRPGPAGFTLIELLLVVVVIGVIAALVLPKFGDVKRKAALAALKNDLRVLATAQELYFDEHDTYADSTALAADGALRFSADVRLDSVAVDGAHWFARLASARADAACWLQIGRGSADAPEGATQCGPAPAPRVTAPPTAPPVASSGPTTGGYLIGTTANAQPGQPLAFVLYPPAGHTIAQVLWTFGDGSPAEMLPTGSTMHAYAAPGSYTATMQVTETGGATITLTATVPVVAPTAP